MELPLVRSFASCVKRIKMKAKLFLRKNQNVDPRPHTNGYGAVHINLRIKGEMTLW
jgi:hypothetical protein